MKCIKDKCKYCTGHDFYNSYYVCTLHGKTFKKNKESDCLILDVIQDMNDLRK